MTGSDLRWLQRFDNFQRALLVLERGVRLAQVFYGRDPAPSGTL